MTAILTISNSNDKALMSRISAISDAKTVSDIPRLVDIFEHFIELKRSNCDLPLVVEQIKAYASLIAESKTEYKLNVPSELSFYDVNINQLNISFKAVRVEILRLSTLDEYKTRKRQFRANEGHVIQIYCEDTSIIKGGGIAFFDVLRACIPQIREVVGEGVVLDFHPARGLEGFGRTFMAFLGWFDLLAGFNKIAVLGQIEKSQIAVQLALSLFSGSFNFSQCIGQINSDHAKTRKSGESNFTNNYSGNYTIDPQSVIKAIRDKRSIS